MAYLSSLVAFNKALIELDRVRSRLRDRLLEMGIPVELISDAATGAPAEGGELKIDQPSEPMEAPTNVETQ